MKGKWVGSFRSIIKKMWWSIKVPAWEALGGRLTKMRSYFRGPSWPHRLERFCSQWIVGPPRFVVDQSPPNQCVGQEAIPLLVGILPASDARQKVCFCKRGRGLWAGRTPARDSQRWATSALSKQGDSDSCGVPPSNEGHGCWTLPLSDRIF